MRIVFCNYLSGHWWAENREGWQVIRRIILIHFNVYWLQLSLIFRRLYGVPFSRGWRKMTRPLKLRQHIFGGAKWGGGEARRQTLMLPNVWG